MELNHDFEVGVPIAEAWEVLTDLRRIAPCMPGAELREIQGDEYRGVVKIKVGPISAEYGGAARFLEKVDSSHRAVLRAEGREARGQGNANATITASLEPSDKGTKITVTTDLQITGKVAQFGRGVLADVSNKLLGQFVENLEAKVLSGQTGGSEQESTVKDSEEQDGGSAEHHATVDAGATAVGRSDVFANGSSVRHIQSQPAEPVDLLQVAGSPLARRVLPVVGGALVIVIALAVLRRLFGGRSMPG